MKSETTVSGEWAFWQAIREELRAYVRRVVGRIGRPATALQCGSAWGAVLVALSTDVDLHDAILSDVFVALTEAAQAGRLPETVIDRRRWTWAAARYIAIRAAGKRARTLGEELDTAEEGGWLSAGGNSPEAEVIQRDLLGRLDPHLSALSEEDRELVLADNDDGQLAEIARARQVPPGTVRSRRSRLLGRLRRDTVVLREAA